MKIEKINDTQIRVTLSHSDLNPRNIKISELAYGSQKAQELFRDMMTQAYEEFGFVTENIPLMIEAVPLSMESIMIVVTKIEDPSEIDEKLETLGTHATHKRFNPYGEQDNGYISKESSIQEEPKNQVLVYSFLSLDDITNLGHKINPIYCGMNSVYKQGKGTYFLVLEPNFMHKTTPEQLQAVLSEFGKMHISSPLSEGYLTEHATLLIKDNAIEVLTTYL